MKKLLVVMFVLLIAFSLSVNANHKSKSELNNECREFGFDFGISRWKFKGGAWQSEGPDMGTSVTGTHTTAEWDVGIFDDFGATGIVVKAGKNHYSIPGDSEVVVEEKNINHITFCFSPAPCVPPEE